MSKHNRHAPWWAAALVCLLATGLATIRADFGPFWRGYVLDMTGPAWSYILFRGRFTAEAHNVWTAFFTPTRTLMVVVALCFAIEGMQYLGLYDATFDQWDFAAYVSIVIPLYVLDRFTYAPPNRA